MSEFGQETSAMRRLRPTRAVEGNDINIQLNRIIKMKENSNAILGNTIK
jgi:hypothetical protein